MANWTARLGFSPEQHSSKPAVSRSSLPGGTSDTRVASYETTDSVGERNSSDNGSTGEAGLQSRRARVHSLTSRTKTKAKAFLKLEKRRDRVNEGSRQDESISDQIKGNPAFNPGKAVEKDLANKSQALGKASGTVHTVVETIIHPIDTVKSKATRTTAGVLSGAERPKPSQESDANYLQAHIDLNQVQASDSSRIERNTQEQDSLENKLREEVDGMEAHRESLRVAWITSRHVDRVRVVPKRFVEFPNGEAFVERDIHGEVLRYEWLKWLGYMILYYTQDFSGQYVDDFDELPFDLDASKHHIERFLMASAPWQAWAMDVRIVYRWEDPAKTGKWLAIYAVLWYTQHLTAFLWAYIIYIVIKHRYFPSTVESLNESIDRTLHGGKSAYNFDELISKHGRKEWLMPLVDQFGPYVQLQLNDMANMLEVFANFYAWRSPEKTRNSLCLFAACLSLALFADMAFCMKLFSFIGGSGFFVSWPIASLHPKYRNLVSPFKWIFWDIPTDAEWSFQYLRRQAQEVREKLIKCKVEGSYSLGTRSPGSHSHPAEETIRERFRTGPVENSEGTGFESGNEDLQSVASSTSILESQDVISFRAQWNHHRGRLIVHSSGIRFVRSLPKKELWNRSFLDMAEMRKVQGSTMAKLAMKTLGQLEFTFMDGASLRIDAMKDRDEAFNTIIGFSGLQWQVLQRVTDKYGNRPDNGKGF